MTTGEAFERAKLEMRQLPLTQQHVDRVRELAALYMVPSDLRVTRRHLVAAAAANPGLDLNWEIAQ